MLQWVSFLKATLFYSRLIRDMKLSFITEDPTFKTPQYFLKRVMFCCVVSFVIFLVLGLMSLWGYQLYYRHALRFDIERMHQEQDWLVREGLSEARIIGPLLFNPIFKNPSDHVEPHFLFDLKGWFPTLSIDPYLIQPGTIASTIHPQSAKAHTEFTYRHEDGHILLMESLEKNIFPKRSAELDGSEELAQVLQTLDELHAKPRYLAETDPVISWLAQVHAEAFADAFSCLVQSRRGQKAFSECVLYLHRLRAFPLSDLSNGVSALSLWGQDHATDPVAVMLSSLDPLILAKLSKSDVLLLSRHLADASALWVWARLYQSPVTQKPPMAPTERSSLLHPPPSRLDENNPLEIHMARHASRTQETEASKKISVIQATHSTGDQATSPKPQSEPLDPFYLAIPTDFHASMDVMDLGLDLKSGAALYQRLFSLRDLAPDQSSDQNLSAARHFMNLRALLLDPKTPLAFGSSEVKLSESTITLHKLPLFMATPAWAFDGYGGHIVTSSMGQFSPSTSMTTTRDHWAQKESLDRMDPLDLERRKKTPACRRAIEYCQPYWRTEKLEVFQIYRQVVLGQHALIVSRLRMDPAKEVAPLLEYVGEDRYFVIHLPFFPPPEMDEADEDD